MTQYSAEGDRVALVVGGASGIGNATACLFRERGWKVVIADRSEEVCIRAAHELGAAPIVMNITSETSVREGAEKIYASFGAPHALVNCAGMLIPVARPEALSMADWDRMMAVNLRGVY